ncbi:hypothetical protein CDAR_80731 [Caerostris darwini]|uniref:Uncharacterized protein n=1 Tax=Caerostris darwini TaxID=1538125 RepID=A0AAV4R9B6_9ARAC|nr:hypothetical protein CDAR_80731 [Caerostris darwini]
MAQNVNEESLCHIDFQCEELAIIKEKRLDSLARENPISNSLTAELDKPPAYEKEEGLCHIDFQCEELAIIKEKRLDSLAWENPISNSLTAELDKPPAYEKVIKF